LEQASAAKHAWIDQDKSNLRDPTCTAEGILRCPLQSSKNPSEAEESGRLYRYPPASVNTMCLRRLWENKKATPH